MAPSTSPFPRIAIVGLGLMGGSWGLGLGQHTSGSWRVGCDRADVLERALSLGAIDEGQDELRNAVKDADLIILATPVGVILDLLPQLKSLVTPRALVTDVGSTKQRICERAREVFGDEPLFLGGHPLAGKERSGLEHAEASLLANMHYALTPLQPEHLADERVSAFCSLLTALGARPCVADASAHDRAVAFLSHLPQLLSSALASLIAEQSREAPLPLELAASGFRDLTRLAESPYAVWRDICLTNTRNITLALDLLIQKLQSLRLHLTDGELEREFERARALREKLREIQ